MKETYWTTKQAVMKKLGKKQDEHMVASDSELDAKLEVFKAIQQSSLELLRVIERLGSTAVLVLVFLVIYVLCYWVILRYLDCYISSSLTGCHTLRVSAL